MSNPRHRTREWALSLGIGWGVRMPGLIPGSACSLHKSLTLSCWDMTFLTTHCPALGLPIIKSKWASIHGVPKHKAAWGGRWPPGWTRTWQFPPHAHLFPDNHTSLRLIFLNARREQLGENRRNYIPSPKSELVSPRTNPNAHLLFARDLLNSPARTMQSRYRTVLQIKNKVQRNSVIYPKSHTSK